MAFRPRWNPGETELIAAARDGSQVAFDRLFREHYPTAVKTARSFTDIEADDIVAEAFAGVFRAISAGGGPDKNFRGYLKSAVRNAAIQHSRKLSYQNERAHDYQDNDLTPLVEGPGHEDEYLGELVEQAMSHLPQKWIEVLWATEVEGLKPRDLTTDLDLSPNAIAGLSRRARNRFRDEFQHQLDTRNEELHRLAEIHREAHEAGQLSPMTSALIVAHRERCQACAAYGMSKATSVVVWPVALWLGKVGTAAKGKFMLGVLAGGGAVSGGANSNGASTNAGLAVGASAVVAVGALAIGLVSTGVQPPLSNATTATTLVVSDNRQPSKAATNSSTDTATDDQEDRLALADTPDSVPDSTAPTRATTAITTTTPATGTRAATTGSETEIPVPGGSTGTTRANTSSRQPGTATPVGAAVSTTTTTPTAVTTTPAPTNTTAPSTVPRPTLPATNPTTTTPVTVAPTSSTLPPLPTLPPPVSTTTTTVVPPTTTTTTTTTVVPPTTTTTAPPTTTTIVIPP